MYVLCLHAFVCTVSQAVFFPPCQAYLHIDDHHLRLYVLLSGLLVWLVTKKEINLCEGLEWKRSLALHLWYVCTYVRVCVCLCVSVSDACALTLIPRQPPPPLLTPCGHALTLVAHFQVCLPSDS